MNIKFQNLAAQIRKRTPDMLSDLHSTITALSTIISVTAVAVFTILLMVTIKYYFILVVLALIFACEFLERYKKTEYDVFMLIKTGENIRAYTVRATIRGRHPFNVEDVREKVAKNEKADAVAILSCQKVDNN